MYIVKKDIGINIIVNKKLLNLNNIKFPINIMGAIIWIFEYLFLNLLEFE